MILLCPVCVCPLLVMCGISLNKALAQAIKEIKEQHPDMSVTKVVVHKESEIPPSEGDQ